MASTQTVKMPNGDTVHLKKSYTIEDTHEYIYTGGAIHFTPDEQYMLTACEDNVKVSDLNTGKISNIFDGDGEVITCMSLVPNTHTCVVASRSGQLHHYDYVDNAVLRTFKSLDGPVASLCWDPSGTLLATGASNGNVKVWDFAHTAVTHSFKGSQGIVFSMAFHPDPKRMLLATSASADCDVKVWDLYKKKLVHNMKGHVSPVQGLVFSDDGKFIVSGGRDKVMNTWRLSDHSFKLHASKPLHESIEGLKLVPTVNGDTRVKVVTVSDVGKCSVWDAVSGEMLQFSQVHDALSEVSLLPQSHRIVVVNGNMDILFLDQETLTIQRRIIGYNDEIIDAKHIDDDHVLVVANSEAARVVQLSTHDCAMLEGHTANVLCADISPCGNYVVTSSKDNTVRVWRKHQSETEMSFECVAIGAGHNDGVSACAFNKKAADASKRGFVVSAGQDLTVKLWNVTGINTQADADTDPSAHEQSMELIPAMTVKGHDKDINTVAVAPNDRMFVTGSHDRTAKLWSTQDLSLLGTLRGHKRGIWHAEFSPVDRVVATASGDKTIKLWSITDFTCVKTLEGHTGGVLKLAFMSRGMQMASSAADGLCKIWTLKTSECEDTMDGHTDKVWALTLNKSESRIVSGGGDSVLNVWRDTTVQQQEEVERVSEEKMLLTQELMNLVQNKQYLKAAKLALRLDQPHRMRELMEEIVESDHVTGGERGVGKVVLALDDSQVSRLLGYVREWNTNARHSRIAQMVLMCVLKVIPPARMVTLDKIKNLIEALLPYSERHFSRLDRLEQQSFFVDYTWQGLRYGMVGNVMEAQHMGMAVKTITDDDKDFLGGDRRATDDTQKDKDPTAEDAPLISMQQQLEVATPPSGAEDGDSKSESESGSEGAEEVAVAVAGETNVADADEWAVEELVIPQSTAETKAGPSKAKRQSVQPTKGVKRQKIELEETDESGDSSDSESGSDNEFVEKMFKESNGATQKDSATPSSMKAGKTSGAKSANRDKSDPSNAEKGSGKSSTKKHNTPKNGTKPKPNSKPKPSSEPTRRSKRRKA